MNCSFQILKDHNVHFLRFFALYLIPSSPNTQPRDDFKSAYGMILLNLINEFERNLDWEMQFDFILVGKCEFVICFIVKGRTLKSEKLLGKFMPTKKVRGILYKATWD